MQQVTPNNMHVLRGVKPNSVGGNMIVAVLFFFSFYFYCKTSRKKNNAVSPYWQQLSRFVFGGDFKSLHTHKKNHVLKTKTIVGEFV